MASDSVSEHTVTGKEGVQKGFLHFYKKDGKWNYVTEAEYEQKKAELPDLCFACKYPIQDLESKPFPDLDELAQKLDTAAVAVEGKFTHAGIPNNNIKNKKDENIVGPRYLSVSTINGTEHVVNTHEGGF